MMLNIVIQMKWFFYLMEVIILDFAIKHIVDISIVKI